MQAMKDFTLWFLDNLPEFLMSEPVKYFVGLAILGFIIRVFYRLVSVSERSF